jgi:hypothetical protein
MGILKIRGLGKDSTFCYFGHVVGSYHKAPAKFNNCRAYIMRHKRGSSYTYSIEVGGGGILHILLAIDAFEVIGDLLTHRYLKHGTLQLEDSL